MSLRCSFVLAAAACTYQPGSFQFHAPTIAGARATVGCLDVAIARRPDFEGAAVLEYRFGNRCSAATVVDLAHARVVGRTADGHQRALAPDDPRGELEPLTLAGRTDGGEALAYAADAAFVEVCVDAATVAWDATPRWLCFARLDASGERADAGAP
jgi:hypothetical protein